MSKYETTLRQIIYHYTQDMLPIPVAESNKTTINLPFGKSVNFAPILPVQDITVETRMAECKNILLPKTQLVFFNDTMRDLYYEIFCIENLEREIEYETVNYFLMRWKTNIKKCLGKYNLLYKALQTDIDILTEYERHVLDNGADDTSSEKQLSSDTKGTRTSTRESDTKENSSNTYGLKNDTTTSNTSENKTVFEDTPENELLNTNYATNITKGGAESSSTATSTNSGTDSVETINEANETFDEQTGQATSSNQTEEINRKYNKVLDEYGRNKSIPELINLFTDGKMNVIESMVNETSKGLFIKIYN